MKKLAVVAVFSAAMLAANAAMAQNAALEKQVDSVYPQAKALYEDIHEHPELSAHETRTAAEMAEKLRALGYEVTEHVGGTGVVAILKNGPGPTVMLRTELDALPVEEKTGLPYASKVRTKNDAGVEVPVMHACGHDMHMSSLWGTAAIMARTRDTWNGTLMLIGQPAEETVGGARGMVADGLFTRFPKPDVGVALHSSNALPAGQVGITPEYALSNSDAIRITVYGRGGHGAAPESTIDPIVIGASIVMRLQTIVAREIHPGDPAVITVGSFQAGTKNNIIPDHAVLLLTVRSYKKEVREHLLKAIQRIAEGEAQAAGAEKMPQVEDYESTDAVYNDPVLAQHLLPVLESVVGKGNAKVMGSWMASEDYSAFIEAGVPSFFYSLGAADPEKWKEAKAGGAPLPSNHSPYYAPVEDPSLKVGIATEVALLRDLLKGTPADVRKFTEQKSGGN